MQAPLALAAEGIGRLLEALAARGFEVVGPRRRDGVVELGPLASAADLPAGVASEQGPGRYRLSRRGDDDRVRRDVGEREAPVRVG